jgi:hypothetical protein
MKHQFSGFTGIGQYQPSVILNVLVGDDIAAMILPIFSISKSIAQDRFGPSQLFFGARRINHPSFFEQKFRSDRVNWIDQY